MALAVLAEVKKAGKDVHTCQTLDEVYKLIDPLVRFRLKAGYGPMLCSRWDGLKPKDQEALYGPEMLWTEKCNGVRVWLMYMSDGEKILQRIISRNYSVDDFGCPDYHRNVAQPLKAIKTVYVADCEIMFTPGSDETARAAMESLGLSTDSTLELMSALLQTYPEEAQKIQNQYKAQTGQDLVTFRLIHPIYVDGANCLKVTLGEGMKYYKRCVELGREIGWNVKPIKMCKGSKEEKQIFLETILNEGGEGVCVHNMKGHYSTSENRGKDFVKIKRSLQQHSGLDDTVDGFVTGFKMSNENAGNAGLIGSLEFSFYMQKDDGTLVKHVCAFAPNLPLEMKKAITITDPLTGEVSMRQDMYNQVAELNGQEFSAKSLRMEHPAIVRFRSDKRPDECVYTEAWVRANSASNLK